MRVCIFVAAIALIAASISGCGESANDPVEPQHNDVVLTLVSVNTCEDDFLLGLSPVLQQWQDSLKTFLAAPTLLSPPVYDAQSTATSYVNELAPVLAQWEQVMEDSIGSDILDTPPLVDGALSISDYLLDLSSTVQQWEVALETYAGRDLLPAAPTYTADELAPTIVCPADTTLECAGSEGTILTFSSVAFDDCDPNPIVVCDPPSGSTFPFGESLVTCTATDSAGNTAQCIFAVTVQDTTPPSAEELTAGPSVLWPPNHKMIEVEISLADSSDACGRVTCEITAVESNEAINGRGDGNTQPDWEITAGNIVMLRAERSGGGDGRVYTIHVRCTDEAGNSAMGSVEVTVPHDMGDDDS